MSKGHARRTERMKDRANHNQELVLMMFSKAADAGEARPSEKALSVATQCTVGTMTSYVRALIEKKLLIRHGERGRYTYEITATGKKTSRSIPVNKKVEVVPEEACKPAEPSLAPFPWNERADAALMRLDAQGIV